MNATTSSLEDALAYVIHNLKRQLKADKLFITACDGANNRIIKAFNHLEPAMQEQPDDPDAVTMELTADKPRLSVPIVTADNHTYGTIHIVHTEPFEPTEEQLMQLQSMAAFIAYAIDLENTAVTDSLTGLYNRRYLHKLFDNGEAPSGVMFIDLNDFKWINDQFGHETGDKLLIQISNRLRSHLRKSDRIIRYGGDEFLICFPQLAEESGIRTVKEKIERSFQDPFLTDDVPVFITASIGVSSNQGVYVSLRQLIANADQAMYAAKQHYKNSL
ncbi:sensor domain-containing diguanylate cyclase [Paenibacillus radicis (ex Gao et al. 2016)]|uniref:sensor domain-containing diguanylate cyclase n=1 Tax=Paenibacillus radicis (ex Gao et al. 2016) TaxID=1737354 RepID=UPI001662A55A|nr:sensor domain-containing diguanylate cyclase [Paenibacillus radicis (ex Gao et al. 2016)]